MRYLLSLSIYLFFATIAFGYQQGDHFSERPNFIFIYSDDQHYDALGANGNPIIYTPELDKLANQGIRFTNANVVFSLCSPSRAALLTGRYGSANGVELYDQQADPDEIYNLAKIDKYRSVCEDAQKGFWPIKNY